MYVCVQPTTWQNQSKRISSSFSALGRHSHYRYWYTGSGNRTDSGCCPGRRWSPMLIPLRTMIHDVSNGTRVYLAHLGCISRCACPWQRIIRNGMIFRCTCFRRDSHSPQYATRSAVKWRRTTPAYSGYCKSSRTVKPSAAAAPHRPPKPSQKSDPGALPRARPSYAFKNTLVLGSQPLCPQSRG